ncbi:hypothetical protein AB4277_06865 [Vibrio splendidus]
MNKGFYLAVKWPGWDCVLKETLALGLNALIGIATAIISFLWILTISPFDDPYLSQFEYQRLAEKEDLMLALWEWGGGIYLVLIFLLYLARVFIHKRKS